MGTVEFLKARLAPDPYAAPTQPVGAAVGGGGGPVPAWVEKILDRYVNEIVPVGLRSKRSYSRALLCCELGLDDAQAVAWLTRHRPTREKYGKHLGREAARAVGKVRGDHQHEGESCAEAGCSKAPPWQKENHEKWLEKQAGYEQRQKERQDRERANDEFLKAQSERQANGSQEPPSDGVDEQPGCDAGADAADEPAGDPPSDDGTSGIERALRRFQKNTYRGDELGQLEPLEPLVEGLIDRGTLVVTYGPSGAGKTQIEMDLAGSVSLGLPFAGRPTTQGTVLYFIGEGQYGQQQRVDAWRAVRGVEGEVPIFWCTVAPNLLDRNVEVQAALIHILEIQPVLVVVDTLSRSMPGGEENGTPDMSLVVKFADEVRQECGATTNYVHHAGKDITKGERGSSVLRGASDTTLQVTRTDSKVRVLVEKEKHHPDGHSIYFTSMTAAGSIAVFHDPDANDRTITVHTAAGAVPIRDLNIMRRLEMLDAGTGVSSTAWKDAVIASELCGATEFYETQKRLSGKALLRRIGSGTRAPWTLSDLGLKVLADALSA